MRTLIGLLIAAVLALGVIFFWFAEDEQPPSTQAAAPPPTTTTSTMPPDDSTTSSTAEGSTSTSALSHVVETEEEAEEILRQLWFGWFEGIYNEDVDRIREVVVLEETVETARESFGTDFKSPPEPDNLTFSNVEVLTATPDCLAVWAVLSVDGFREGSSGGVHIIRWDDDAWRRLSLWQNKDDLWESDCDSSL